MTEGSSTLKQKPPVVSQTSLGYQYVRCQRGDSDDTVYIHQLCAILDGADPHDVFSDCFDTHHLPLGDWLDVDGDAATLTPPFRVGDILVPAIDTPDSVKPQPRWEHRQANLEGAKP